MFAHVAAACFYSDGVGRDPVYADIGVLLISDAGAILLA